MTTRLLLAGGFLGAGKTTLLLKAAQYLIAQGYRVGMVTNDQAQDLVDTAMARQYDIPVMEVAGGCFCCRFPDLLASIEYLQESVNPDIILAEPVGSCTDLISTIFRPLHVYYPAQFQVAPLTVLVDPFRDPQSFPREVGYIYEKQLTEANIITVSKMDLLDEETVQVSLQTLQQHYPAARVLALSAQTGEGLPEWLEICLSQADSVERVLEMNYETYARGEAHLGWLNAKGQVSSPVPFFPSTWMTNVFHLIERECQVQGAAVAHIKMHVTAGAQVLKVSLTQLGRPISWDLRSTDEQTTQASFVLNARVSATPETLEALIRQVLTQVEEQMGIHVEMTECACFSPLPPRPIYRLLAV